MRKLGLVFLLCGLLFVIPAITQASIIGTLSGTGQFDIAGIIGNWWTITGNVDVIPFWHDLFGATAAFSASGTGTNSSTWIWSLAGVAGPGITGTTSQWDVNGDWMFEFTATANTFPDPYSMRLPSQMYFNGYYSASVVIPGSPPYRTFAFGIGEGEELGELSTQKDIVPIPGAVWLLGSGLLALVGLRRMRT